MKHTITVLQDDIDNGIRTRTVPMEAEAVNDNEKWLADKLASKGEAWNRRLRIEGDMRYIRDFAPPVEIAARFALIVREFPVA